MFRSSLEQKQKQKQYRRREKEKRSRRREVSRKKVEKISFEGGCYNE
jgi:hypothetical protein